MSAKTSKTSPALLKAARKCGRGWADNGATCSYSELELTADDCAYIKNKHPRAWQRDVVDGNALPELEQEARRAFKKTLPF